MSLITVEQFRLRTFAPGSRPHPNTVIRWLRNRLIPGRQIGKQWYVDSIALDANGNPLVEKVLRDVSRAP